MVHAENARRWLVDLSLNAAVRSWAASARFLGMLLLTLSPLSWLAFYLDRPLARHFKPLFGGPLHLLAVRVTELGKADIYFGLAGLGFVLGLVLRRRLLRNQSVYALAALTLSGLLVQVLKHLVGRQRPYADLHLEATRFDFVNSNYEWHSLPSGHSQVAFTVAATMVLLGPKQRAWQWSWFAVAATIAMTRVVTLNHWLSDTLIGAFVGVLGTVLAFRLVKLERS
ncbi:MAG: phosphatase PAP2 family protein [Bdellovibrionales bacterium]|nr:phosphatase PAP2 family protein [Bdellovibrionales bacterium]